MFRCGSFSTRFRLNPASGRQIPENAEAGVLRQIYEKKGKRDFISKYYILEFFAVFDRVRR